MLNTSAIAIHLHHHDVPHIKTATHLCHVDFLQYHLFSTIFRVSISSKVCHTESAFSDVFHLDIFIHVCPSAQKKQYEPTKCVSQSVYKHNKRLISAAEEEHLHACRPQLRHRKQNSAKFALMRLKLSLNKQFYHTINVKLCAFRCRVRMNTNFTLN